MRIPPSTIVMSLVLAVPIGLAIRDTLKDHKQGHRHVSDDPMIDDDGPPSYDSAVEERRRIERDMEQERQRAQDLSLLRRVQGQIPAQLGPLFGDLELGAPAPVGGTPPELDRLVQSGDLTVHFDVDTKLNGLVVTLNKIDRDTCRSQLTATWSTPSADDVWLDPSAHQRTSLDVSSRLCQLRFDRYDPPQAWVKKLPLTAVGSPVKSLAVDPSAYVSDHEIDWRAPGVGSGHTPTNVSVSIANGKVTDVLVNTDADAESLQEIRDALSAKLGHEPEVTQIGRTTRYTWPSRAPVMLVEYPTSFSLEIGSGVTP